MNILSFSDFSRSHRAPVSASIAPMGIFIFLLFQFRFTRLSNTICIILSFVSAIFNNILLLDVEKEDLVMAMESNFSVEYLHGVIHEEEGSPICLIDKISQKGESEEEKASPPGMETQYFPADCLLYLANGLWRL